MDRKLLSSGKKFFYRTNDPSQIVVVRTTAPLHGRGVADGTAVDVRVDSLASQLSLPQWTAGRFHRAKGRQYDQNTSLCVAR